MKHPKDIIPHHLQKDDNSCVAWGTEIILQTFEETLLTPSLQDQPNFGYAEAMYEFCKRNIKSSNGAFGHKYPEFKAVVEDALSKGVYPSTIIPAFLYYHEEARQLAQASHTYIICKNGGDLEFLTCTRKGTQTEMVVLPENKFRARHDCWAKHVHGTQALLLHTLVPQPRENPAI